jgi:hypothetical protein
MNCVGGMARFKCPVLAGPKLLIGDVRYQGSLQGLSGLRSGIVESTFMTLSRRPVNAPSRRQKPA